MTLLTGCSSKASVNNCYYPEFPNANKEVKLIISEEIKQNNNKEFKLWLNDLVKYKEKIKVLKEDGK